MQFPDWINSSEVDITIKLNDLCNASCLHCVTHGLDRSYLNITNYENDFLVFFENLYSKGIRTFSIAFVGGEITLIEDSKLTNIIKSFCCVVDKFINNSKEIVSFDVCLISNFIFGSNKKYLNTFKDLTVPFNDSCNVSIVTSYDIGLERFKNEKIESLWRKNCISFGPSLSLLVTLNKSTCNDIEKILTDSFFQNFKDISFQPMLNLADKNNLMPTYQELFITMEKLSNTDLKHSPFILTEKRKSAYLIVINNDGILSCGNSEEVKRYGKKAHFHIKDIKENLTCLDFMLKEQITSRIKKTKNKYCLSCEYYSDCDFGFEFFDESIKCPAFKIS